jgi:hypothetical protein
MKNAFDIIFDQAKSIQLLQEKVTSLQNELEKVVIKLKSQNDDRSLTCSCSGKRSVDKPNMISTGMNTSLDHNQPDNQIGDNSIKSKNSNKFDENEKYDRFDHFLNENSINFPKQFLDIDSKHFDSREDNTAFNIKNSIQKNENMSLYSPINNNCEKNIFSKINHINLPKDQTNFDITSTSVDPSSFRYVLKVPSICKNNGSILHDDTGEINIRNSQKIINVYNINLD